MVVNLKYDSIFLYLEIQKYFIKCMISTTFIITINMYLLFHISISNNFYSYFFISMRAMILLILVSLFNFISFIEIK